MLVAKLMLLLTFYTPVGLLLDAKDPNKGYNAKPLTGSLDVRGLLRDPRPWTVRSATT